MKAHDVTDSRGDVYRVRDIGDLVVCEHLYGKDHDYLVGDVIMTPAVARQIAANIIAVCDEMDKNWEEA